jgi:tetratricopeptide (TPR) repeat protein
MRLTLTKGLLQGALALAFVAVTALPALAQVGSLRGKVVDAEGKPVADAEITFDFVGDITQQLTTKTDSRGQWVKTGMPARPGSWTITVKKGELSGRYPGARVRIGEMTAIEDIKIVAGGGAAARVDPTLSAEEVKKRNERQEKLAKLFEESNAAFDAGNYDEAVTKVNGIIAEEPNCAACHAKLGDIYSKKQDLDNAEKSYLKAIELDPKNGAAYGALATIYNSKKQFDKASEMASKASELMGGAAPAGEAGAAGAPAGGNAEQVYNQGIILWNASKPAEAQAQFERAVKLDPKMADAHYWLGMTLVSQGKLPQAKAPLQEYLKLAPSGEHADTAKALLAQIK